MAATDSLDFNWSHDPIMAAMANGTVLWGDICADQAPASEREEAVPRQELPEDWDLDFPELRLRKDIWTEFPVTVVPLGRSADGAERHAISWHRTNFEEWRNTRAADYYEAMDYAGITEHRLMKCLNASKYWAVEDPIADGMICVIRMNFVPREEAPAAAAAAAAPVEATESDDEEEAFLTVFGKAKPAAKPAAAAAAPAPAPVASAPLLTRLNAIKDYFPVVWHKVEDVDTRTAIYALEIFGRKITEMAHASRRSPTAVRDDVEKRLMAALRASPAWRVLRSEGREFCRLEMA